MVKLREDVDGCGCIRCQDVAYHPIQRSLPGALAWSGRLPIARPSIVVVLFAVSITQLVVLFATGTWVIVSAVVGVIGAFVGRGYIGIVGRGLLGQYHVPPYKALQIVIFRLPAFLGAVAVILGGLSAIVLVTTGVSAVAHSTLEVLGLNAVTIETIVLLILAAGVLYILIRLCFVPEACFIGGYGPLDALRVSWTITTLQTRRAAAIVVSFCILLGLGILLDMHLGGPNRPLVLSIQYRETTVVLRSFGISATNGLRSSFDLLITTIYSGVFAHQYIAGVFEQ